MSEAVKERLRFYAHLLDAVRGQSGGFIVLPMLLPNYVEQLGATGVIVGLFVTALGIGRTTPLVTLW